MGAESEMLIGSEVLSEIPELPCPDSSDDDSRVKRTLHDHYGGYQQITHHEKHPSNHCEPAYLQTQP
jgi:hypothetical protein